MFNHSIVLETEIDHLRKKAIARTKADETKKPFLIMHIIPETFQDSNYDQDLYRLVYEGKYFSDIFSGFNCATNPIPMVNGLRFDNYNNGNSHCKLFNNGVAEYFSIIDTENHRFKNGLFRWVYYWEKIAESVDKYFRGIQQLFDTVNFFICIDIIGCKGVTSQIESVSVEESIIDSDKLYLAPVVLRKANNNDNVEKAIKLLKLRFVLALGIRPTGELTSIITDVYRSN